MDDAPRKWLFTIYIPVVLFMVAIPVISEIWPDAEDAILYPYLAAWLAYGLLMWFLDG